MLVVMTLVHVVATIAAVQSVKIPMCSSRRRDRVVAAAVVVIAVVADLPWGCGCPRGVGASPCVLRSDRALVRQLRRSFFL